MGVRESKGELPAHIECTVSTVLDTDLITWLVVVCRVVLVTQICLMSATSELRGNCCQSQLEQPIFAYFSSVTVPTAVTLAAKERLWLGTLSQLQAVI